MVDCFGASSQRRTHWLMERKERIFAEQPQKWLWGQSRVIRKGMYSSDIEFSSINSTHGGIYMCQLFGDEFGL